MVTFRAVSAALHTPNWGGTKFSPVTTYPQRKLRPSKFKYEALEISEAGGPLKKKCLYITVTLDPLESKVFAHYICCWGPFERKVAYLYVTVAVGPLRKQGTLHIAVDIGGLFERVVSVLTHYICYCKPL